MSTAKTVGVCPIPMQHAWVPTNSRNRIEHGNRRHTGDGHLTHHLEAENATRYEGDSYGFIRNPVSVSLASQICTYLHDLTQFYSVSGLALGELVSVAKSVRNPDQTWVSLARAIWLM
jgi:hypothetical protein